MLFVLMKEGVQEEETDQVTSHIGGRNITVPESFQLLEAVYHVYPSEAKWVYNYHSFFSMNICKPLTCVLNTATCDTIESSLLFTIVPLSMCMFCCCLLELRAPCRDKNPPCSARQHPTQQNHVKFLCCLNVSQLWKLLSPAQIIVDGEIIRMSALASTT